MLSMLENGFNFISFFITFNLWWRSGIVWSVSFGFDIWSQKGGMEGVVNAPGLRKFEFVREWP